ncbi:MAG: aldehyde dehydrogenase [Oscillospiraceae bacterium]|nr:aldehyde dehydrogenase [Oscillospiraceae bacterium]
MEIKELLEAQQNYYLTGATHSVALRTLALDDLYRKIKEMEPEIHAAIQADLGKSSLESYMCETGLTLSEITYMKKHLRSFASRKRVRTPLAQFPSKSYILKEPYGNVLIMSPWNYPFLLTMEPLVDAIAAGNTAILKPSAYSPATSAVIKKLVSAVFPEEYVAVVEGGREENTALLEQPFDYIFFTGGTAVGQLVLQKAAQHFTPVTLEMGGKSPCIVDRTANLKVAAQRIAFGKYLNCGQTCVAPDYLLIHEDVKDEFLTLFEQAVTKMYGANPLENPDYGRIVNHRHFDRLSRILEGETILFGGQRNPETLQIAPTLVGPVEPDGPAMRQEIFGPILPYMTFTELKDAINFIRFRPKPLALYMFSTHTDSIRLVQNNVSYGGGCVNDTIIHLATSEMGFGGVGMSGMGSYHGKKGFDTFTHEKSTVEKANWLDLPFRYQPYDRWKEKLIRMFLK